jgi:peptidoglycan/xylan/chitin deacetylase (PgdA/CDA1 family)
MTHTKATNKRFFSRTMIEFLVAFITISFIAVHGYVNHEDFIDNEKLEVETSMSNTLTSIPKTSTTTIPILVYHKISKPTIFLQQGNTKNTGKFNVQSDVFEAQIKYVIDQGYTLLTMQELIKDEQSNTLPQKPISITFDDGWRGQYENALPILTKYHIRATFYIYTGVIGSLAYMTWDDLHALVNLNMEIGDHSKSHPRLTKIDPSKLDEELVQSKHTLERNLHVSITDFAYPYGNYNSKIIEAVKNSGYISARTSNKGIYNDFKDLYQLNVLYAPKDLQTLKDMLDKKL